MSNSASSQPSQAGGSGAAPGSQNPPNTAEYLRQPGRREPPCPRCTYRAANVGRAIRQHFPTANQVRVLELIGELACITPVGQEQSANLCDCCRTYRRDVEFHYPPWRGFEESSGRIWKSLLDLAGHCDDLDAQPNPWQIGVEKVEEASRDFLACWHEVCRQYGKDLLQMNAQELRGVGCTSVVTISGGEKPVAARPTSAIATSSLASPRAAFESVLEEIRKMGKDFNNFATEFHKHAEHTKTEIELLNDTTAQLEADFAQLQIQDKNLATSFEDHSVRLIREVKELAQFVRAQGKTLTAVKTMVDRLAINFHRAANAPLTTDGTGEQHQ